MIREYTRAIATGAACIVVIAASTTVAAEEHDRFHTSLFVGTTVITEGELQDTGAPTLGVDLEYQFTRRFGLGTVVERAFGSIDSTTALAVADIHIGDRFVLQVGPGVEWIDDESYAVGRIGVFYEIEFDGFIIAPAINYDISEGEDSLVLGANIGLAF